MFRYVSLIWNSESAKVSWEAEDLERRIKARSANWNVVLRCEGLVVLVADCSRNLDAHVLCADSGVVLGEIFERVNSVDGGVGTGGAKFGPKETRAVVDSEGRLLVSRYWGNFVALVVDANRRSRFVFKDPCGSLPCHFTTHGGIQIAFSCLADCVELGLKFSVNWSFVRSRVVNGLYELCSESLTGIATVHRGECVEFDHTGRLVARSAYWNPASFEGAADLITDPEAAAKAMRASVLVCTRAMAAPHASVLAQVSGGLDSSIVLGCLSQPAPTPDITCYTGYVPESVCDERRWARCAVDAAGSRHLEIPLDPGKFIYKDMPPLSPSMGPASFFAHWQKGPIERPLAAKCGATAVFTGEGGDSVFCATSFIFAVDHSLRRHGLGLRTLSTAVRVAARRDRTVWNILWKAIGREVFGRVTGEARLRLSEFSRLVSSEVRGAVENEDLTSSTWLASVCNVGQETLLRLGPLAFAPGFYDLSISHHDAAPYVASPLLTQPVFEICARIPVDVHFDAGRTRGLARRAFTKEVPEPILRRQWKDRPLLQLGELIGRNLPFIRETLLDGELVRRGILDRAAVEQAMGERPSSSSAIRSEILSHLDTELWARRWA